MISWGFGGRPGQALKAHFKCLPGGRQEFLETEDLRQNSAVLYVGRVICELFYDEET